MLPDVDESGKLLGEEYSACINQRLTQSVSVIKEKINLPWDKDIGRIALWCEFCWEMFSEPREIHLRSSQFVKIDIAPHVYWELKIT